MVLSGTTIEKIHTLEADIESLAANLSRAEARLIEFAADEKKYEVAAADVDSIQKRLDDRQRRLDALHQAYLGECQAERQQRCADAQRKQSDLAQRAKALSVALNEVADRVNVEAARAIAAAKHELAEAERQLGESKKRVAALSSQPAYGSAAAGVKAELELIEFDDSMVRSEAQRARGHALRLEQKKIEAEGACLSADMAASARWSAESRRDWSARKAAVESELAKV